MNRRDTWDASGPARSPRGRLPAIGAFALVLACIAGLTVPIPGGAGDASGDLLPITRIFLKPDRLARELHHLDQGALRRMPREEFEEKARRASRALAARQGPPRLLEATYRA